MDYDLRNQTRAEGLREDFYQAITDGDWDLARNALTGLEEMRIDTKQFRSEMDEAIAETGDITYEPYEAVIPVITEAERLGWMQTHFGRGDHLTFGASDESIEQSRLSAEQGPNNA